MMRDIIKNSILEHKNVLDEVYSRSIDDIERVAEAMIAAVSQKQVIYWLGNGGSAADSQHLAAELIGRFTRERKAIASVALTTDSSILTCLSNDYSFDDIFSRQVEGLVRKGDIVIGISTSGNSKNVFRAMELANDIGAISVGLLGRDGGDLKDICKYKIIVPSSETARIQEMHIMVGHILCDLVERAWCSL